MDLTTDTNYPQNGDDLIRNNLVSYFSSTFGIGDDVTYSRLYTPINSVPGHAVNSLEVSLDGTNWSMSNVVVPFNAIATLETIHIYITKT